MRRILLWSALGLSLSANVAVAVTALSNRAPPRGKPGEAPIFSRVALDAGQRARVLALREKLLADRDERARSLAELRVKLAEQLAQDPVNTHEVERTLVQIEAGQAGFQRRVVSHVLAIRDVLREDQRPAFFSMVAEHMKTGMPLDPTVPAMGKGGMSR